MGPALPIIFGPRVTVGAAIIGQINSPSWSIRIVAGATVRSIGGEKQALVAGHFVCLPVQLIDDVFTNASSFILF